MQIVLNNEKLHYGQVEDNTKLQQYPSSTTPQLVPSLKPTRTFPAEQVILPPHENAPSHEQFTVLKHK